MNTEDFVNFECSKRLKALGYEQSESNRHWYMNDGSIAEISPIAGTIYRENVCCVMPTLAQACKWLRSKGLSVHVYMNRMRNMYYNEICETKVDGRSTGVSDLYDTYEEAQSAGIDVALGMLEGEER